MIHPDTGAICTGPAGEECTIYPAVCLVQGEKHELDDASIQRFSDHYACSCPAWRFHAERDVRMRSCHHLVEALGDAYESTRMTLDWIPHTPSKRRGTAQQARQRLTQYHSPESPATPQKRRRTSAPSTPSKRTGSGAPLLVNTSDAIIVDVDGEKRVVGRQDDRVYLLLASLWPGTSGVPVKSNNDALDPAGFWVSEKLDGVRAFWDGRRLWSRRGKEWNAPSWFLERLPSDLPLDGELWIGRDMFEHTSGVCRSNRQDEWEQVKYMVFDTPAWPDEPVENRWARIQKRFSTLTSIDMQAPRVCLKLTQSSGVYFVEQVLCTGQAHLDDLLQHVLECDGEGYVRADTHPESCSVAPNHRTSFDEARRFTNSSPLWTPRQLFLATKMARTSVRDSSGLSFVKRARIHRGASKWDRA